MPSAETPIRITVLGAGAWARVAHLTALSARDDVVFESVYDPSAERAEETAAEFGFAHVAANVEDALARGADGVIVSSPAALHAQQAIAAIEAGSHVLLEKPMTTSAADAWAVARAAERHDRHVLMALGWNYSELFATAKRLLAERPIGDLEHVSLHHATATRPLLSGESLNTTGDPNRPALASTWIDRSLSGGGFGNAQLSHALGVLFGLVDSPAVELVGINGHSPHEGIELSLAISGVFGNGATLAVSGVAVRPMAARQELNLGLYGSEGSIRLDFQQDLIIQVDSAGAIHRHQLPEGAGLYPGTAPALAFADLLTGTRTVNESNAVIGARSTEVLDALL